MKKLIYLIMLFILSSSVLFAQSERYQKSMLANLEAFNNASEYEEIKSTSNQFERIAQAEPEQWLPAYYAALGFIHLSFRESQVEKKDEILDKAEICINGAIEKFPGEVELLNLEGYLYQARIQVDFMNRGMKYGPMSSSVLQKAIELDPENPRAYFLLGQNIYFTPEMFGGGKEIACPILKKAREKFEVFQVSSAIEPDWGRDQLMHLLDSCDETPEEKDQ